MSSPRCAAVLLTGALVLMRSGPLLAPGAVRHGHLAGAGVALAIAAAFSVLLLADGYAIARGARDVTAGSLLAWAALPYAFAAGAWAVAAANHAAPPPGSLCPDAASREISDADTLLVDLDETEYALTALPLSLSSSS